MQNPYVNLFSNNSISHYQCCRIIMTFLHSFYLFCEFNDNHHSFISWFKNENVKQFLWWSNKRNFFSNNSIASDCFSTKKKKICPSINKQTWNIFSSNQQMKWKNNEIKTNVVSNFRILASQKKKSKENILSNYNSDHVYGVNMAGL